MIGPGTGSASFDENGVSKYQNRRTVRKTNIILLEGAEFIYFHTDEQFRSCTSQCLQRDIQYG